MWFNLKSLFFCSWWTLGRMFWSFIMTGPPSRPWSRWCVQSATGWMKIAPSCTTSIWWSCWPSARRAKTSTPRSNATPCCRWMILSVWSHIKTAFLRLVVCSLMRHHLIVFPQHFIVVSSVNPSLNGTVKENKLWIVTLHVGQMDSSCVSWWLLARIRCNEYLFFFLTFRFRIFFYYYYFNK